MTIWPDDQALRGFRNYIQEHSSYPQLADLGDAVLTHALRSAEKWVSGRRWSIFIVAINYLVDGYHHA